MPTSTLPPLFILFNHFNDDTTIIFNGWIKNGDHILSADNRNDFFELHAVGAKYQKDIENALAGKVEPYDLSKLSELDAEIKQEVANFAYSRIKIGNAANPEPYRQLLIQLKDPNWALAYCRDVSDDKDMRQVILDAGDPFSAYVYCCDVENIPEMRQAIIDADDPEWIARYCWHFINTGERRKITIDADEPEWA